MVSHEQRHFSLRVIASAFALVALITPAAGQSSGKIFYPDDPLLREPAPRPATQIAARHVDELYDFLSNSFVVPRRIERPLRGGPRPALDVNTLGDVPDSAWYANRHYYRRMSTEELKRGPGNSTPPDPSAHWQVISAKSDGITPGLVIVDQRKNRYLLKFDPPGYPELASGADVIGSKIFFALGYNTPENYIVHFCRENLEIAAGVRWRAPNGKMQPLTSRNLDEILKSQPKGPDGAYRALASRWISGKVTGPFAYEGTRSDDPNDIVPHEERRELRGLRVFAAWLNHTDAKSINTIDSLVTEDGTPYLKHYLLDFGSILGSAATNPKETWYGHEYITESKPAGVQMVTLGLYVPRAARSSYPDIRGVGRLDSWSFDPVSWKADYPNPAFLLMDNEDAFWAAKQVAAFTDAEIRALVETGEYTDPRATDWITDCLIKRRDKIARTWLSKLPFDRFTVAEGKLLFDDVAVGHSTGASNYSIHWQTIDSQHRPTRLPDSGPQIPMIRDDTQYLVATLTPADSSAESDDPIDVYLRSGPEGFRVIGIDRR